MPESLHVVVASHNPAKQAAVRNAFAATWPSAKLRIEACAVPSGVGEQPLGDVETRQGATNRAHGARKAVPAADYWVGLEGGLERIDDAWLASAWMAVLGADGRLGLARTQTLPLPPPVQRLLDDGMELGPANDQVFGTRDSKQAGGAYGLLTGGRLTRGGVYAGTLELALLPWINPLWAE